MKIIKIHIQKSKYGKLSSHEILFTKPINIKMHVTFIISLSFATSAMNNIQNKAAILIQKLMKKKYQDIKYIGYDHASTHNALFDIFTQ